MMHNTAQRFILCCTIGVFALVCAAALFAKEPDAKKKTLETVLSPAIKAHRGDVAIAVKHLKTGESFEHRADEPMPTASLIKFPIMISAYTEDAFAIDHGWTLVAVIAVGYMLSRGIAKAGSYESYSRRQ